MAFLNKVKYKHNQARMYAKLIGIPFNLKELQVAKALKAPCGDCTVDVGEGGYLRLKTPLGGYTLENLKTLCAGCYSKL